MKKLSKLSFAIRDISIDIIFINDGKDQEWFLLLSLNLSVQWFFFFSTTSEHGTDGVGTPRHAPSIQRIRALFGEKGEEPGISPGSTSLTALTQACHPESLREGWLHCKVTAVEGKVKLIIHARQAFFVS